MTSQTPILGPKRRYSRHAGEDRGKPPTSVLSFKAWNGRQVGVLVDNSKGMEHGLLCRTTTGDNSSPTSLVPELLQTQTRSRNISNLQGCEPFD